MMVFKFYRAQVTGGGYIPQGDCQATLSLDEDRNPTWTDMSEEFRELCLPWFSTSVVMGILPNTPEFKPYSDEALEHLSKHQLPGQGYVMMTISSGSKKSASEPPSSQPTDPEPPKKTIPGFAPQQFFVRPPITHNELKQPKKRKAPEDSTQD